MLKKPENKDPYYDWVGGSYYHTVSGGIIAYLRRKMIRCDSLEEIVKTQRRLEKKIESWINMEL